MSAHPAKKFTVNLSRVAMYQVFGCMVFAIVSTMALAQAGQLDSTFAKKGIFLNSFNGTGGDAATVVALQSDGKIVVGGQINNTGAVIRLNPNGTLDSSFGSGGIVTIQFRVAQNITTGLAIQTDGKILVTGTGLPEGGQLDRLNPNGTFDTSFGSSGVVTLGNSPAFLALQSDGKILLSTSAPGTPNRIIQRYDSNGQPDTTFGSGGSAPLVDIGPVTLQGDGRILVPSTGLILGAGLLTRYNTNGSLDRTFGLSGSAAAVAAPAAAAVQSDGHIVTAGTGTNRLSLSGNSEGFGLERFTSKGSIDATFGQRGGVSTGFPNAPLTGANALLIQPNGDIVAAGEAGSSGTQLVESFALARYLSTGQLDTTFGTGGLVTTSFGNTADASINALALQGDGKIVAVGTNGGGAFIVARYLGQ